MKCSKYIIKSVRTLQVEIGAGSHLAVRVGHFDLVRAGVGTTRLVDGHRQRIGVGLVLDRLDAELDAVVRFQRRVPAEPLRVRLRSGLDLAAEHDRLAFLP